uniref:Prostaglandin E synthase 3 n=1 Tax=Peromyscus maniculatus bairdii TaxID=230844 RepID=A0A8C8UFK4_PERMB
IESIPSKVLILSLKVYVFFYQLPTTDINANFEKSKLTFSCFGGSDNFRHLNKIDLFHCIDPNDSKKRMDRLILCCLWKGESGQSWPDNFDCFSEMMDHMGGDGDVDLPEVDGADDDSQDSDDEKKKCQIWSKECCHCLDFVEVK